MQLFIPTRLPKGKSFAIRALGGWFGMRKAFISYSPIKRFFFGKRVPNGGRYDVAQISMFVWLHNNGVAQRVKSTFGHTQTEVAAVGRVR